MELAPKQNKVVAVPKTNNSVAVKKKELPFFLPVADQPKLMVGAVDDFYEREANIAAERLTGKQDGHPAQINSTQIDRQYPGQPLLPANLTMIQAVLDSAGQSLDYATKAFMESRFRNNFSNIKIHSDSKAHASSGAIKAQAFAYGNHIVFGKNKYRPHTLAGRRLLAHELTHTLQQKNGQKLIQREPDKSIVDSGEFEKAFGSPPDLKTVSQVHVKVNPVVKKLADKFLRIDSDPTNLLGIWIYVEQEAEKKVVNPGGDPEMDFLFDLYKMLGRFAEAKALSEKKKYIPQKTAFYSAGYYKEVLMGDLSWLPAHPVFAGIYPRDLITTYQMYFWGPAMKIISIENLEKLKKISKKSLDTLRNKSGLIENEQEYVAIQSFIQADRFRYKKLVALDSDTQRRSKGLDPAKKDIVAASYMNDAYWEKILLGTIDSMEAGVLLRNVKNAVQRIAFATNRFWEGTFRVYEKLFKNKAYQYAVSEQFIRNRLVFLPWQAKLVTVAKDFLQLQDGELPSPKQLNRQKILAVKRLKDIIVECSKSLIRVKSQKASYENNDLADAYGFFIFFMYKMMPYLQATDDKSDFRNSSMYNRLRFATYITNIGSLVHFPKLVETGNIAIQPEGRGISKEATPQKRTMIAISDSPKHNWVSPGVSTIALFGLFNKEVGQIDDSIHLSNWLTNFFYYSLMVQEQKKLDEELAKGETEFGASKLASDYKPIPVRLSEYLASLSGEKDSIVPRRFVMTDAFFSVVAEDMDKFDQKLYNYLPFRKAVEERFSDSKAFYPVDANKHYDAGGIIVWVVSHASLKAFAAFISKYTSNRITIDVDYNTNILQWYDKFYAAVVKQSKDYLGSIDAIIQDKMIKGVEQTLSHSRRRALSHHRRILLKYFLYSLWDTYGEDLDHIDEWENPFKAIDMILAVGGGYAILPSKDPKVDEQAELKLQIATVILELGEIMDERLFNRKVLGGLLKAKTNKIGVAKKLLPHIIGAISLEKKVMQLKDDLHYDSSKHDEKLRRLGNLKTGLLGVLHDYYESEVRTLSSNEREIAKFIMGPDTKEEDIPKKIYAGDWLHGKKGKFLEDRNSNNPFHLNKPILQGGKTYMLIDVHQDFYYRPAIKLEPGGITWELGDVNPSTLILPDGDKETSVEWNERKGTRQLFTYTEVDIDSSSDPSPITVTDSMDLDEHLGKIRNVIAIESTTKNLMVLKDVLEVGAEWLTLPFYFIPGIGQAVLVGEMIAGVVGFLASSDFQTLKKLLSGGASKILDESFDYVKSLFVPEELWNKMLDERFNFPSLSVRQPVAPDVDPDQKTDGKLKKLFLSFVRFGKKIVNSLHFVKALFNYSIKSIHYFILNRPMLDMAVSFVADKFYAIKSAMAKIPGFGPGDKVEEPRSLVSHMTQMMNNLREMRLPLNLVPLNVIIDFIIRMALKVLKGPKGIIAESVRTLLDKVGIYDKVVGLVARKLGGSFIDPNTYLNNVINANLQRLVTEAGANLATELGTIVSKIPGVSDKPEAPTGITFIDSGETFEDEPETQPYASNEQEIESHSLLPLHASGGDPLDKKQSAELSAEYGRDFSHVRIHQNAEADQATRAAGAKALTTGSHIYLASGMTAHQGRDKEILKHELAHVLQQTGPRVISGENSSVPVDGKPGKGLVFDKQKESEADQFAQNKTNANTFSGADSGNSAGIYPSLTDVVLSFFKNVSAQPAAHQLAHLQKVLLTTSEHSIAQGLADVLKQKMTVRTNFQAGSVVIKNYLDRELTKYTSNTFIDLIKASKEAKLNADLSDVNNWLFKQGSLKLAIEEFIAIKTGLMSEIRFSGKIGATIDKFEITNLYPEKIDDQQVWELLINNTFVTLKSATVKTQYAASKLPDYIRSARQLLSNTWKHQLIFDRTDFKFTNKLADAIEFAVKAGSTTIHRGEYDDPIPIRWSKTGYFSPIRLKPDKSLWTKSNPLRDESPVDAYMDQKTLIEVPARRAGGFGLEPRTIDGKKYYYLELGVESKYKAKEGKKLQKVASGQRRLETNFKDLLFEAYNFGWTHPTESSPDHVQDLGFGGDDAVNNLWPLDKKHLNSDLGNKVYNQKVMYLQDGIVKENAVSILDKKWFVIESIGNIPE